MKRRGFSLLEMLLVTALVAVISLSVFLCLSNGLRLWSRMQRVKTAEAIAFFFDRFSSETANAFLFSTLPLQGENSSFVFPTIIYSRTDTKSSRSAEVSGEQIGVVGYFYDSASGEILRRQADYGLALHGAWHPSVRIVSGVNALRFLYYYRGDADPLPFKDGGILPFGVMVEVDWLEQGQNRTTGRYFVFPAGV